MGVGRLGGARHQPHRSLCPCPPLPSVCGYGLDGHAVKGLGQSRLLRVRLG